MKPIILIADQDNQIKITPDEIEKIVDDAYQAGYEDGKKMGSITCPSYPITYDVNNL